VGRVGETEKGRKGERKKRTREATVCNTPILPLSQSPTLDLIRAAN
jgi:hypothetical protein